MDDWSRNFCQNLRHLRKVHNLTQKQMAQILGISVATLGKMERCDDSVRIRYGILFRVCTQFQISADDILTENWPEMLAR